MWTKNYRVYGWTTQTESTSWGHICLHDEVRVLSNI